MKRIRLNDQVVIEINDEFCENCKELEEALEAEREEANRIAVNKVVGILKLIRLEYKPRTYGFDKGYNHAIELFEKRLRELEDSCGCL